MLRRSLLFLVPLGMPVVIHVTETQAQSTRRWVAPSGVVQVLMNGGNYTAYLRNQFYDWDKGGTKLSSALKPLGAKAKAVKGYKDVTRTQVPDGVYNECVAFSRGCSGAPGSTTWRRGRPVIFDSGVRGGVTPGTVIATFAPDGKGGWKYSGHTGLFAGYITAGGVERGISLWDQNWLKDKTIIWHNLSCTGTGNLADAKAYYVVETAAK